MYESFKNFEIDEFWNDCININGSYIENNRKNNSYINNISNNNNKGKKIKLIKNNKKKRKFILRKKYPKNIQLKENETDYIKSKIISKTESPENLNNIKEALIKEELIPILNHRKQEKTNQFFNNLYKKDLASRDLRFKNSSKQKENKEKLKIEECTFKPEKCKNKKLERKINKLYNNTNIYERNLKQQQKHNEKVAFLFNETNKISNNYTNSECYFHPYINNNKNIDKILYDDNIWKNNADNDSTKLFLLRYMKAREEKFEKKVKLNSPTNKKLTTNFSYPKKMIRSLSQKDSLIMKKNLHKTLYSFKNLFTDEDEEDNDKYNDNENNNEDKLNDKNNIIEDKKKSDNLQWTFAKKNDN